MKKNKNFKEQKSLNKFKQQNQDCLKLLKTGNSVTMYGYTVDGLKQIDVAPRIHNFDKYEYDSEYGSGDPILIKEKMGVDVLCLFGKGKSRKLRVMKLLEHYGNKVKVSNDRHTGVIPAKYLFGDVVKIYNETIK
jgi:hypothetical protein